MAKLDYRPDIDGLRAIAVLSVTIYHIWPEFLVGGYLGVDVFFVISGYLISSIILKDLDRKSFSFTAFYKRRIRRIIPAQTVTILATLLFFLPLLSSSEMVSISESAFYSTLSLANVYFFFNSGYFDQDTAYAPLVHMWSLGVEEQFYIFWPLVLFILFGFNHRAGRIIAPFLLGALFTLSLLTAQSLSSTNPSLTFYMFPFRVFEFLFGVGLCFVKFRLPTFPAALLGAVGVLMMILSFVILDHHTLMPGYLSIVPCLGAALCIWAGSTPAYTAQVLGLAPFAFIGRISYSLYLVHWPVVVWHRIVTETDPSLAAGLLLFGLMIMLALFLHYLIELPFRFGDFRIFKVSSGLTGVALMLVLGTTFVSAHTWTLSLEANSESSASIQESLNQRIIKELVQEHTLELSRQAQEFSVETERLQIQLEEFRTATSGFSQVDLPNTSIVNTAKSAAEPKFHDIAGRECKAILDDLDECTPNVLIIGDSHASYSRQLFEALTQDINWSVSRWNLAGCLPTFGAYKIYNQEGKIDQQNKCKSLIKRWETEISTSGVDIVVLAGRWGVVTNSGKYAGKRVRNDFLITSANDQHSIEYSTEVLKSSLEYAVEVLENAGKRVVLLGQVPLLPREIARCIAKAEGDPTKLAACPELSSEIALNRLEPANTALQETASESPATLFFNTSSKICNPHVCQTSVDGIPLYSDDNHLSKEGARILASMTREAFVEWLLEAY